MEKTALLFDMDGVLIDVSASYRFAIQLTVEHFLGLKVTAAAIQEYKNRGGANDDWQLTRRIILDNGKDIALERVVEKFQEHYRGDGLRLNEKWLLDKDKLARLKKDYCTGIVTGRNREEAGYALDRFGTRPYFDEIVTIDDLPPGRGKPDPLGIATIMARLRAGKACYFGDTIDDMRAATAAGAIAIGVLNPAFPAAGQERLLEESGARLVLPHIAALAEALPLLDGRQK
jgi:HAD superfamily hydrolase (TIGR01548 family)